VIKGEYERLALPSTARHGRGRPELAERDHLMRQAARLNAQRA
jgi:hypothetical protein